MSETNQPETSESMEVAQTESFPVADTKDSRIIKFSSFSKLWILTVLCLIVAAALTWMSVRQRGTEITIAFKQGHGLKAGDFVRHRGIDIGTVTKVSLNDDLSGITANVELNPGSNKVAHDGSRFWIVRPQVDLSGVRGLETAVGAKYIAVSPGPLDTPIIKTEFIGVESPPVDTLDGGGLELVLRGAREFGTYPGSPVTWRGFKVGQVVSSNLSPDAMYVDTVVRIAAKHRRLVNQSSKFWSTSGFKVDVGVSGFSVDADSLTTIARGGVSFSTLQSDKRPVEAGDIFTLHAEANEEWIKSAPMNLLKSPTPKMVSIVARWQESLLGFSRNKDRSCWGLLLEKDGVMSIMLPTDITIAPEAASENSFSLAMRTEKGETNLTGLIDPENESLLAQIPLDAGTATELDLTPANTSRIAQREELEDCYVVREIRTEDSVESIIELLGRQQLTKNDRLWQLADSRLSGEVWHGAPVLSSADEKIIGVLLVADNHTSIVLLSQDDIR